MTENNDNDITIEEHLYIARRALLDSKPDAYAAHLGADLVKANKRLLELENRVAAAKKYIYFLRGITDIAISPECDRLSHIHRILDGKEME